MVGNHDPEGRTDREAVPRIPLSRPVSRAGPRSPGNSKERLVARRQAPKIEDKEIKMATLTLPVEEKKKIQEQEALITGAEAIAIACTLANVDAHEPALGHE